MATDSEYLCMLCEENEASHEYCDDCLEALRGDYVIASSPTPGASGVSAVAEDYDWVVHVTQEQEQYGYVADTVDSMLSSGRGHVLVWSGSKAQAAPDRCAPESGPAKGSSGPLHVLVDGVPRPLSTTWWDDLAGLVGAGHEELVIAVQDAIVKEPPAAVGHPGPRRRPSALAG